MNKLLKSAILSISLLIILTGSTVSPALGEISKAFPESDENIIKLVLTLPSFVIVPVSIVTGRLTHIAHQKRLIIIGLMIFIIGGIGGGFAHTISSLLLFRGILGLGMGLLTPLTTSLIADFYKNSERREMMGYSNAVANLGGIIATLLSGWLAIYSWRYIFGIYSLAIIVLILVIVGLPEPPPRDNIRTEKIFINKKVLFIATLGFILNIAFYAIVANIALFIQEEGMGNSGYSGFTMSLLTLAGFISSMFLNKLSYTFKHSKFSISTALMGLGFLVLSKSTSLIIVLIAAFMIGFGQGIIKPLLLVKTAESAPKFSNAFALSIVSSFILLGKFASPFALHNLGLALGNTNLRFIFYLVYLLLIFIAIAFFIYEILVLKIFKPRYSDQ